jgi:acyl carrier protein
MAVAKEEIFEKVREVLVDALGVDEEEVIGSATLMGDLGAESIDFLDIVFRLEKAFGIKVPREELFPIETMMNNPQFVSGGKFTAKGLAKLKKLMPHTDLSALQSNPDINKLGDLFTVDSIVNYITSKLSGR